MIMRVLQVCAWASTCVAGIQDTAVALATSPAELSAFLGRLLRPRGSWPRYSATAEHAVSEAAGSSSRRTEGVLVALAGELCKTMGPAAVVLPYSKPLCHPR